ncbi:MAG: MurR/RpiR family transcriptional regulator [Nannocystaceae bacterium]
MIASFGGMRRAVPLLKRESDFKRLVVEHYGKLPRQQQLVADFMLDHLEEVPLLSVPELSGRSGASEATVVRFAQRIGYDGFASLRADLLEAVRQKVVPDDGAAAMFARVPQGDTFDAIAEQEMGNIQRSIASLDRAAATAVADALFRADSVCCYGVGISAHLAALTAYLLAQIGLRAQVIPATFSSPLEPLVSLRQQDAVLVLSLPPYSRASLDVIRAARDRGATTVAICDRITAPAAALADHVLTVKTENMMYTNSFAAISALLNGLATTIAVRHPDAVADKVAQISALLDSTTEVIDA